MICIKDKQTNNKLKENLILRVYTDKGEFNKVFVGTEKESIEFLSKYIKLSENIPLSKIFIKDLLRRKTQIFI